MTTVDDVRRRLALVQFAKHLPDVAGPQWLEDVNALVQEIDHLDQDLGALWEKHGTPGVNLDDGMRALGRPGLLER